MYAACFYLVAERDMEMNMNFGERKRPISLEMAKKFFDSSFWERNEISQDEQLFLVPAASCNKKTYCIQTKKGELLATFGRNQYKGLRRKEIANTLYHTLTHPFRKGREFLFAK